MYTLIKRLAARDLLMYQAPTIGLSMLIAEIFFKFGSFSLEAMAFLATWLVLDGLMSAAFGNGRTKK